ADIDGDGDLDLFVGGRAIAGRYPAPPVSKVYRNEGGRFLLDQPIEKAGLVTAATFTDIDGDGSPDLVIASEWGPVRIFMNEKGRLTERDFGLSGLTGWWNSVATGDFDGDGRPDIVAGNWGINTPYPPDAGHPLRVYYGDLRGDGGMDLVDSYVDRHTGRELPLRNLMVMGSALPFLRETAGGFEAYGKLTLQELYGERLQGLPRWEATTLQSMVFLNRGSRFEAHPLPAEAQWSAAFGLAVADLNGDGNEDIVMAQNFSPTAADGWPQDAGRGLLLLGDGRGGFTPLHSSGLEAYGDGRGLAVADYDGDGRPDLVVAQNGASTLLYHNETARPGLRIRLKGAAGNESAIGAKLRGESSRGWGPLREVKAGTGYWSQDGAVQVLSGDPAPARIAVQWPSSHRWTTNDIPAGNREMLLTEPGIGDQHP
ncbi:MAG TPA: RNA-binding protein, partial [Verrucomicrobiales bacterium]|nr:RNA-binding protein [Verrucomicrobiales bacterium]